MFPEGGTAAAFATSGAGELPIAASAREDITQTGDTL